MVCPIFSTKRPSRYSKFMLYGSILAILVEKASFRTLSALPPWVPCRPGPKQARS